MGTVKRLGGRLFWLALAGFYVYPIIFRIGKHDDWTVCLGTPLVAVVMQGMLLLFRRRGFPIDICGPHSLMFVSVCMTITEFLDGGPWFAWLPILGWWPVGLAWWYVRGGCDPPKRFRKAAKAAGRKVRELVATLREVAQPRQVPEGSPA